MFPLARFYLKKVNLFTKKQQFPFTLFLLLLFLNNLAWISSITGEFEFHHDGLILQTISQFRESFANGSELPFNQYGNFWPIPYVMFSLLFSPDHLLLSVRVFTLVLYFLSEVLFWKVSRIFVSRNVTAILLAFYVTTSHFAGLRPWPSTVATVLSLAFVFLLLRLIVTNENNEAKLRDVFFLSLLTWSLVYTRIQVGALIFLFTSIFFIKLKVRKFTVAYFSAFLLINIVSIGGLTLKNSSLSSIYDTVILSTKGIRDSTFTTFPKFTLSLVVFFVLFGAILIFRRDFFSNGVVIFVFLLGLTIFQILVISYVVTEIRLGIESTSFVSRIMRRLFVAIVISSPLVLLLFSLHHYLVGKYKKVGTPTLFLSILSCIFLSQLYPLFDASHAWWAGPTSFICAAVFLVKVNFKFSSRFEIRLIRSMLSIPFLYFLVFLGSVFSTYFSADIHHYVSNKISIATTQKAKAMESNQLDNFFFMNLKQGSRVLNMCINPNVFLGSNDYRSVSRYFVFWNGMEDLPDFKKQLANHGNFFVVYCDAWIPGPSDSGITMPGKKLIEENKAKLRELGLHGEFVSKFYGPELGNWEIWKVPAVS